MGKEDTIDKIDNLHKVTTNWNLASNKKSTMVNKWMENYFAKDMQQENAYNVS